MSLRDIKINANEKLRGKYFEALLLVFSVIFIYSTLWLLEFFSKGSYILFLILTVIFTTPVLIGAAFWFAKATDKKHFVEKIDFFKVISNPHIVFRGFLLTLTVLAIQAAYFAGILLCIQAANHIFTLAQNSNNTVLMLLISVNLLLFSLILLFGLLKTMFSLAALPVLFTNSPTANPFVLIHKSFETMNGHKFNLFLLIISYWYIFPLLPLFLPKIISGVLVFIHDISAVY
jgi:hypothetical protein